MVTPLYFKAGSLSPKGTVIPEKYRQREQGKNLGNLLEVGAPHKNANFASLGNLRKPPSLRVGGGRLSTKGSG